MSMPPSMTYQAIFQALKGVAPSRLGSFTLPVRKTGYALCPIDCRQGHLADDVVSMLTDARNAHVTSFLTRFQATAERTAGWLINAVGSDSTRILFAIRHIESGALYGYMGLGYGSEDNSYIEADAIVRYAEQSVRGLMNDALQDLVAWVKNDLGIPRVGVRVLSDNPALAFYAKCGFQELRRASLYPSNSSDGDLMGLAEAPPDAESKSSPVTLVYMEYR